MDLSYDKIKELFKKNKNYPLQLVITNTITNSITKIKSIEYKALWGVLIMNMLGIATLGLDFQNHNKAFDVLLSSLKI